MYDSTKRLIKKSKLPKRLIIFSFNYLVGSLAGPFLLRLIFS